MRRVSSRNIYFLLLCLCLLIFCGCTKSTGEETDTTEVPATTEALETVELKRAEVGDIVQMGTYEQDGDTETEDPIYWDVLDKDGDSILIISHDVIGYQRFSDSPNCVIWEDSQIRTWLNEEFYTDAFDKETQARIRESVLENPSIAGYVTSGVDEANQESRGDATDRIFLLSQKEIEKYYGHKLPKAEALLCKPSKAVLQRYEEIEQQRVREKVPFVTKEKLEEMFQMHRKGFRGCCGQPESHRIRFPLFGGTGIIHNVWQITIRGFVRLCGSM